MQRWNFLKFYIKGIYHHETRSNFFFEIFKLCRQCIGGIIYHIHKSTFISLFGVIFVCLCLLLKFSHNSRNIESFVFIYVVLCFFIIWGQFKIEIIWFWIFKLNHHINCSNNTKEYKETHQITHNNHYNHATEWRLSVFLFLLIQCMTLSPCCHIYFLHYILLHQIVMLCISYWFHWHNRLRLLNWRLCFRWWWLLI